MSGKHCGGYGYRHENKTRRNPRFLDNLAVATSKGMGWTCRHLVHLLWAQPVDRISTQLQSITNGIQSNRSGNSKDHRPALFAGVGCGQSGRITYSANKATRTRGRNYTSEGADPASQVTRNNLKLSQRKVIPSGIEISPQHSGVRRLGAALDTAQQRHDKPFHRNLAY